MPIIYAVHIFEVFVTLCRVSPGNKLKHCFPPSLLIPTHLARFGTNVEFLHALARNEDFSATTCHTHPQGVSPRESGRGRVGAVLQPLKEPVLLFVPAGRAEGSGGQFGRWTKTELVVRHVAGTGFGCGHCGCGLVLLHLGCILYTNNAKRKKRKNNFDVRENFLYLDFVLT